MFLKSYVEIPMPFSTVSHSLTDDPNTWLPRLAETAELDGESLLVDVGLTLGGHRLSRQAEMPVGRAMTSERTLSLPFQLRVSGGERLFPDFEGTIDAAWLGPRRTQLSINAQYEPPLGLLGRTLDRALLHRVAETVARGLLSGIAEHITQTVSTRTEAPLKAPLLQPEL